MNVALSSRHSVHAADADSTHPKCHAFGAPHGSEAYRPTTREVTCKKCLKALAAEAQAEAEYQDRLAASMSPATESHDLGYVHADEQAAADAQPEEVKAIREEAEQTATGARLLIEMIEAIMPKPRPKPVVTSIALPQGVFMDPDTRILSGTWKHMRALMDSGLAVMTDDGDLVLR